MTEHELLMHYLKRIAERLNLIDAKLDNLLTRDQ
jgi:hypothetical protein